MRPLTTAAIIAIGTELLTPDKVDTNSLYITARLNEIGIDVIGKCVVGDDPRDLERAVHAALERADVVVTSGGLGPTADDLTRESVAAVLGLQLYEDPALVALLLERFAKRRQVMPEINKRQAMVPEGAIVSWCCCPDRRANSSRCSTWQWRRISPRAQTVVCCAVAC